MTNPATIPEQGVSVRFFAAATKSLSRQHGARNGSPAQQERLRAALAEAEASWLEMQAVSKS